MTSKAYVKAYLSSVSQFRYVLVRPDGTEISELHPELMQHLLFLSRDALVKNEHLFPEEEQKACLSVLTEMQQSAHTFLLSPVHELLRVGS